MRSKLKFGHLKWPADAINYIGHPEWKSPIDLDENCTIIIVNGDHFGKIINKTGAR